MAATRDLERGRAAYREQSWAAAHAALALADSDSPLGPDDLELLATAAYMLGHEDEHARILERAHRLHLEASVPLRAVRCAFWIAVNLMLRGEMGPATGWLGRAERLLAGLPEDCTERGYLLMPVAVQQVTTGDLDGAYVTAARMIELATRDGDADLLALALHEQGHAQLKRGRTADGLRLLDEAMVAVVAGELSPLVTGLIYCSVIDACQEVFALGRAGEWTQALSRWCDRQPDLMAFTGRCLVHRAEILQLRGDWPHALAEAERAGARCSGDAVAAEAHYRRGEVHRVRGELAAAEDAFRDASLCGREPQPGLALLRLAQGAVEAAAAAIRRALGEATQPLARARLLPARVEIALAAGDEDAAREACVELAEVAAAYPGSVLQATAAQARGAVELAGGRPSEALPPLREALAIWHGLDAPYEAARVRALLAVACRGVGDDDTASFELDAAHDAFARLGAAIDLAGLEGAAVTSFGLTDRELQVLGLVANGRSNREIAAELVISEHTVARHVQNIFVKLDVSSRTAAGAVAFRHELVKIDHGTRP